MLAHPRRKIAELDREVPPDVELVEPALADAARVVLKGVPNDDRTWLKALSAVARRVPHPGCAERLAGRYVPEPEDDEVPGPFR
ncbi:MAG: hypothetical protein KIT84_36050 [Labilithrix sp.]|nr:hypothetical protein [Labilithrix sp.]MCW5816467.1 hypothetical protein [Labilithrix sp.]